MLGIAHIKQSMRNNPIGVFDSGVGGLNVLEKCAEILPSEKFIYLADEANMPYGTKPPNEIRQHALDCACTLFEMNCKAIVVACNTATVNAVNAIREMYPSRIVIGLEPAVKPCFRELGRLGYAVALVTAATFGSDKFNRLICECDGRIKPVARPELAKLIEDNVNDIKAIAPHIYEILAEYKDAEAVILGCSHYTYITDIISDFYSGNIKIYDGASGAAQQLKYCLKVSELDALCDAKGSMRFYSTYFFEKNNAENNTKVL